jgi:hypothetical protein
MTAFYAITQHFHHPYGCGRFIGHAPAVEAPASRESRFADGL